MQEYHDNEWGKPVHDDNVLFEFLVLEGAQAGLTWQTILNRRGNYRKAFDNFDFIKISKYGKTKIKELLQNEGIIRNRLKIESVILNAQKVLEVQREFGSFDKYVWSFVGHKQIKNCKLVATTNISDALSKDLKKRGFKFVGSTICYAFMQAVGLTNDHARDCFRHGI